MGHMSPRLKRRRGRFGVLPPGSPPATGSPPAGTGSPPSGGALPIASTEIIFASASYPDTQTSSTFTNTTELGGDFVIDTTVLGAFTTLIVEGQDIASGKWYEIGRTDGFNQISTRLLRIHPYATDSATSADHKFTTVNAVLPLTWRVVVSFSSATPTTFSVGASLYSGVGAGLSHLE